MSFINTILIKVNVYNKTMKAYHEISLDSLEGIQKEGLLCTPRGDKGDDESIIRTDRLLDKHRPTSLKDQGVSRGSSLYAYAYINGYIISITDGTRVALGQFLKNSTQAVLEVDTDPRKCFVSNLDRFDALKLAIKTGKSQHTLRKLADLYWSELIVASELSSATIHRPEIMIPYDIPPDKIIIRKK